MKHLLQFGGGLVANVSKTSLGENDLSIAKNVVVRGNAASSRDSLAVHTSTNTESVLGSIRALGFYSPANTSEISRVLAAIGSSVVATDTEDLKFNSGVVLGTSIDSTAQIRFAQSGGLALFTDGANYVQVANFPSASPSLVKKIHHLKIPRGLSATHATNSPAGSGTIGTGLYEFCLAASAPYSYRSPFFCGGFSSYNMPSGGDARRIVIWIPDLSNCEDMPDSTQFDIMARHIYCPDPAQWYYTGVSFDPTNSDSEFYIPGFGGIASFPLYNGSIPYVQWISLTGFKRVNNILYVYCNSVPYTPCGVVIYNSGISGIDGRYVSRRDYLPLQGGGYVFYCEPSPGDDFDYVQAGQNAVAKMVHAGSLLNVTSQGALAYSSPPKKVSILCPWKSRVVYVSHSPDNYSGPHNTLYISCIGDPTSILPPEIEGEYPDSGAYVTVNDNNEPITGICQSGSGVLVCTRTSTWFFDGDSPASFRMLQISPSVGCASHESMADCDGVPIWFSGNSVYMFNGTLVDIGEKIEPLLSQISEARKRQSFSVYDRQRSLFMLFIPYEGELVVRYTHDCYVFNFDNKTWTMFTGMPGGHAIYVESAKYTGLLLADKIAPETGQYHEIVKFSGATKDFGTKNISVDIAGRFITEPIGHAKRLERVRLVVTPLSGSDSPFGYFSVYINENASYSAISNTIYAKYGSIFWRPPLIPNATSLCVRATIQCPKRVTFSAMELDIIDTGRWV